TWTPPTPTRCGKARPAWPSRTTRPTSTARCGWRASPRTATRRTPCLPAPAPGGRQGATGLAEPHDETDEHGTVRMASIATYGDTAHPLLDRSRYHGPFLPGFITRPPMVDRS